MTTLCYPLGDTSLDIAQTMDEFLAANERRAYRMALIATGNREDALEIVQDAMIKLVQKYAKRDADEWPPLFHRILQSKIRDWYRRSKVKNSLRMFFTTSHEDESNDDMDCFENHAEAEPGQALKQQQAMQMLEKTLHQLPLRQQQAFLLRQWEGLDVAQTAEAMGCSQGSVKTHLSRAMATLRQQLEDHWP